MSLKCLSKVLVTKRDLCNVAFRDASFYTADISINCLATENSYHGTEISKSTFGIKITVHMWTVKNVLNMEKSVRSSAFLSEVVQLNLFTW